MKLVKVDFRAGGDGSVALYIDDKLFTHGDSYHDKIDDYIRGFIDGLKKGKVKITYKEVDLEEDNEWVTKVSEDGEQPPKDYYKLFPEKTYKIPDKRKKPKPIDPYAEYIGLTVKHAEKKWNVGPVRVTNEDGEAYIVTMDYRMDRLNVWVKDGKIVKVTGLG